MNHRLRYVLASVTIALAVLAIGERCIADIPRPGTHGVVKYWPAAMAHVTNFSPFAYDARIAALTPDYAGGVWFGLGTTAEHIDGSGKMHNYRVSDEWLWEVSGFTYDPAGRLWFSLGQSGRIGTIDARGAVHTEIVVPRHDFPDLHAIAIARNGTLWFEDYGRRSIGVRTRAGFTREIPLPDGGFPLSMMLCGEDVWTISAANYGSKITIYKVTGRLAGFKAVKNLVNGAPSMACDANGNVWFASAAYQEPSLLDTIDSRGQIHQVVLPFWDAYVYSGSNGSIWLAGFNAEHRYGAQLVIARVDQRMHLVFRHTLRLANFDGSLASTDPHTVWVNLAFPHSVLRIHFDK